MPWRECERVGQRREFVELAQAEGANMAALCRRFGISRKTGYKWLGRYATDGAEGLVDRSRRPSTAPSQTAAAVEQAVVQLRLEHPAWGGRKIHQRLRDLGAAPVPAPSTITGILRRHDLLDPAESHKHRAYQRFERAAPNELWQMDFKGHFALSAGGRCHPLTTLDDHSRFNLALRACHDERGTTVQQELTGVFREYGLPKAMLMDNGSPWGADQVSRYTPLTVWLMRLEIEVIHGRPWHPQTQGKEERFHRTLKAEVLAGQAMPDLASCQEHFDAWRVVYNTERPHEALGMAVPAQRYVPSLRSLPESLPAIEYGPCDAVRRVQEGGIISFRGQEFRVGQAFKGFRVALQPTPTDGLLEVHFCRQRIARIDLHTGQRVVGP